MHAIKFSCSFGTLFLWENGAWMSVISILMVLLLALAQCCTMLQVNKLLHLNCSMISYNHYIVSASSICIPNTTREPKQFFICWCCCCCQWQQKQLFLICIMLSSLKKNLSQWFSSIYALDLLTTHNSSIGCHRLLQSWNWMLVNLLRIVSKQKSGQKAWKGRNLFVVLLMHRHNT